MGCAGWSLPRATQTSFPAEGNHLQRYAARLNSVEINSSFYRPHRREVYARWAEAVPEIFRFSVKLPRAITHDAKLVKADSLIAAFMEQVSGLGARLGCLLVQLPPSLALDLPDATAFFGALRNHHAGPIAIEPRHASWFSTAAEELLHAFGVSRVLADPARHAAGERPGGWPGLVYCRLHGSPRVYYSPYSAATLNQLAARVALERAAGTSVWCILDNTASGAATGDALALSHLLALTPGAA